ncbi:hypothetical protein CHUAL_003954 [Chamberlinius hualienensis]
MGRGKVDRQCDSIYNILWYLLLLVGIDRANYKEKNEYNRLRSSIFMTIKIVYCIFAVLFVIIIVVHTCFFNPNPKIAQLSFMLTSVVSTSHILIMYGIFVFRKEKLAKLLWKLNVTSGEIVKNATKVFKLILWGCSACIFVIILVVLISIFAKQPDGNKRGGFINVYVIIEKTPIFPVNHTISQLWTKIELCLIFVGSFGSMMCNCVFFIFYVFIAKLIWVNFDLLAKQHSSLANYELVKKNKNIKNYKLLCEIVELFEEIFTEISAVWSFTEMFTLILLLRLLEIQSLKSFTSIATEAFISIAVTSSTFLAKAHLAAGINDKVRTSLWLLQDFQFLSSDDNIKTNMQIMNDLYRYNIQVDPPTLTGWKLYEIKKSYILNAFASVLTYVLVLYNIHDIKADR